MVHRHSRNKPPFAVFLASIVVIFFLSLSAADSIGFVPSYIDGSTTPSHDTDVSLSDLPTLGEYSPEYISSVEGTGRATPATQIAFPTHLTISSVGIDLPVQNPKTTDVDALDALLQRGPARYSASAKLGEQGNVVIFAHSSHLPIVHNKMYQAFNNVPNAKMGDTVAIHGSDGKEYIYSVESVVRADVNDGVSIPLTEGGAKLTLVTCDTLTGKSARYILTASFVGTD